MVDVSDKTFVGIGKIILINSEVWNIPHLHFLVDKESFFEATCIEFGLVSTAKSPEEAISLLISQTFKFIIESVKEYGFSCLIKEVSDHSMDDYWCQYRTIEFTLAENGADLSSAIDRQVERAVKSIINEKINLALDRLAESNARDLVEDLKRATALDFSIEYSSVKVA